MVARNDSPAVVLVGDDEVNRSLLPAMLATEGIIVVGQFGTAGDGVAGALKLRPDVVLMDLRPSDLSGIEATREIVHSAWPTQVIVLTDGSLPTRSAHAVGAFTYLTKGSPLSVIRGVIFRASAVKRAIEGRARRHASTDDTG